MKSPIFIVGANRSGTTLLRLVLNAHSSIAIPDEMAYFRPRLGGVPVQRWRRPGLSPEQYSTFVANFLTKNEEALAPLDLKRLHESIISDGDTDFRRPYQMALEAWAQHHGKTCWGEKTPGNLFYVDTIKDMFPNARFLYIVRDPRAGVNSMNGTRLFSNDVTINALNRRKYMAEGLTLLERFVSSRRLMVLRYEDLTMDPQKTTKEICAFLDEPFEPDMLAFHKTSPAYMQRRAVEEFNNNATRPIDVARMDAWRDQLSPRDIAVIESICRDEMLRFGYELDGVALRLSDWGDRIGKYLYWRIQCWRNRNTRGYIVKYRPFQRTQRRVDRLRRLTMRTGTLR